MFYLLSRTNPEIPGGNPEGFAEPRFINELESSGFFEEMNRQLCTSTFLFEASLSPFAVSF
jgi:hypothetical protein